jgi:LPS sulfotransferase NodH
LICFNWLKRWLEVFPVAPLHIGFEQLTQKMNAFICPLVHQLNLQLIFSSA